MLERNLLKFRCPATNSESTGLEVFERRIINGVEHIYKGNLLFEKVKYPIHEGIVSFSKHSNASLYDKIWETSFDKLKNNEINYDDLRREKLLTLLGCRTYGWLENKSFLDLGSGLGRFSCAAAELGADTIAVDSSLAGLKIAFSLLSQQLTPQQFAKVDFVQANIMDRIFAPGIFNVVFSAYVLHHTPDIKNAFKITASYVKDKGHLAVTVFNPDSGHSPLLWMFRSAILEIPKEIRERVLAKLGIVAIKGIKPIIDVPEILNELKSDSDIDRIISKTKLNDLLHPETLSTDYIWIQGQQELAQWFSELGFFVEYQLGETTVGKLSKPDLIDKFKRAMIFQKIKYKLSRK